MWDTFVEILPVEPKNAGAVLVVVVLGITLYSITKKGLKMLEQRGALAEPVVRTLRIFARWFFLGLTLLLALQTLGILENVWAALLSIVAMVAIGFFAVWSLLSNTLCTLLILIYKPFKIGDWVELPASNLAGEAIDLTLIFTTLRGEDNELIRIPNNSFFQQPIRLRPGKVQVDLYEQLTSPNPHNSQIEKT